ncbi:MAG: glycosyltransferase family 4 protein [Deltaproteobacteria bacterium]|nr:glycosyltransferase family 4 protein [Deltaproteobacteria bacterium]
MSRASDIEPKDIARWRGRRVLMLTSSYPASATDFRARFVHDMAIALKNDGARCCVVAPRVPASASYECLDGISIDRFEYPGWQSSAVSGPMGILDQLRRHPEGLLSVPAFLQRMARAVARRAAAFEPDLILAHWVVPSGLALRATGVEVRSATIAHSSDVHLLASLGPLGRGIARWIDAKVPIFATSQFLARTLTRKGLSPNPPVLSLGVQQPSMLDRPPKPKRAIISEGSAIVEGAAILERPPTVTAVCAMGRFIPIKGFELLLNAVRQVPHLTLTIAGDGPLRAHLQRCARAPNLAGRVEIRAPVLDNEKAAFFGRHDIFAFTGISRGRFVDNLPISALEAMAHGCAIVSTRVGAMPELLANGCGILADADAASLAAALSKASMNLATMSRLAREEAKQRAWPQVSRRLLDLTGLA